MAHSHSHSSGSMSCACADSHTEHVAQATGGSTKIVPAVLRAHSNHNRMMMLTAYRALVLTASQYTWQKQQAAPHSQAERCKPTGLTFFSVTVSMANGRGASTAADCDAVPSYGTTYLIAPHTPLTARCALHRSPHSERDTTLYSRLCACADNHTDRDKSTVEAP